MKQTCYLIECMNKSYNLNYIRHECGVNENKPQLLFTLLYPYFWLFYLLRLFVLFTHRCQYNEIWCDCHINERVSLRLNQVWLTIFCKRKCLHQIRNMTVVIYSFDVIWAFDFANWWGTFLGVQYFCTCILKNNFDWLAAIVN